ncbi:MAG TPA: hypothetical protein VGN26_11605 [Armatimonadota bacterium]|jgi:hypothetical protein
MPQAFTVWLGGPHTNRAAAVAERLQTELRAHDSTSEILLPSHLEDVLASGPAAQGELAAYLGTLLNPHGVSLLAVVPAGTGQVARPLPQNLLELWLVEASEQAPDSAAAGEHAPAIVSLADPSAGLRLILGLLQARGWISEQARYAYTPEEEEKIADMLDQLGYI